MNYNTLKNISCKVKTIKAEIDNKMD